MFILDMDVYFNPLYSYCTHYIISYCLRLCCSILYSLKYSFMSVGMPYPVLLLYTYLLLDFILDMRVYFNPLSTYCT